jgi:hypothetical protein
MMRCPVCRAENDQGPACRRCKADLSLLFRLEGQRARQLVEVYRRLGLHQVAKASSLLTVVEALRRDDETRRLRILCQLLRRDYTEAAAGLESLRAQNVGSSS